MMSLKQAIVLARKDGTQLNLMACEVIKALGPQERGQAVQRLLEALPIKPLRDFTKRDFLEALFGDDRCHWRAP